MNDERYEDVIRFLTDGTLPKLARSGQFAFKKKYGSKSRRGVPLYAIIEINGNKMVQFKKQLLVKRSDVDAILSRAYNDPEIVRFGRDSFYDKIKQSYANISKNKAFEYLKSHEAYQLHLPLKPRRTIKSVIVSRPNAYYQVDLIELQLENLSHFNAGYKYVLNIIDIFSKYLYSYPLKSKDAKTLVTTFTSWLNSLEHHPTVVQSDNGSEFIAKEVKELFKSYGVKQVFSNSYTPQSNGQVERVNYTLKKLLFTIMSSERTKNWLHLLTDVVNNYNESLHSATEERPIDVENGYTDNKVVRSRLLSKRVRHPDTKLKVGDTVRISKLTESATRKNIIFRTAYVENWSRDIFTISKVLHSRKNTTQSRFKLVDKDGSDIGAFYEYELQLVPVDTIPIGPKPPKPRARRVVSPRGPTIKRS